MMTTRAGPVRMTTEKASPSPPVSTRIDAEFLRTYLYGTLKRPRPTPDPVGTFLKTYRLSEELVSTMPKQVKLGPSSIPGERLGVFAVDWIREGTEMGPFLGRILQKHQVDFSADNRHAWEVFSASDGQVLHFLDASDASSIHCWMSCVQCARHDDEQNLDRIQVGNEIYYRARKAIPPDQELLVWYSASQPAYLGIPDPEDTDWRPDGKLTHMAVAASTATSGGRLKCVVCKRGFNSRSNLRSHMRIHTMEKPFACKFCQRSFSQSSTLRNHVRLHTGEKPYKCLVCHSAYSQLAGLRAHQKSARHRPALVTTANSSSSAPNVLGTVSTSLNPPSATTCVSRPPATPESLPSVSSLALDSTAPMVAVSLMAKRTEPLL